MKRKEIDSPGGPSCGRRQPQVSCSFCRAKKLKCDRGQPCTSCTVRGLPCTGANGSASVSHPIHADAPVHPKIHARLQSLEKAVFGISGEVEASKATTTLSRDRQRVARFLDLSFTRHEPEPSLQDSKVESRKVPAAPPTNTPFNGGRGRTNDPEPVQNLWKITQDDALSLLQDFVDNPCHLLPIIHGASTIALIKEFYAGKWWDDKFHTTSGVLILSIFATSAYFYNESMRCYHMFTSSEEAAKASLTWHQQALRMLEESQGDISNQIAGVQARAILAYLTYNTEGCSARFRYLHGCSVTAARDASLHLIDSPSTEQQDDVPTREIKRRLWWHIASTDWMLGLMGGPFDGTYAVQLRHMNVEHPRNLNDNDLNMCSETSTFPLNVPTQMSVFLQRIRLAEICRSIIDARPPGRPEIEMTDYNTVMKFDRLFEQALSDFPPFLQLGAPIPMDSPPHLSLQRSMIQMSFHSRRARLHRSFLLHDTKEKRYEPSRKICLHSARVVLSISMGLLESSLATLPNGGDDREHTHRTRPLSINPLAHRLGIFVGHLFNACTVLALYAGLITHHHTKLAGTGSPHANPHDSQTLYDIHADLARACHVLTAVGRSSQVAAVLARDLISVLRLYHIKGFEAYPETGHRRDQAQNGHHHRHSSSSSNTVGQLHHPIDESDAAISAVGGSNMGIIHTEAEAFPPEQFLIDDMNDNSLLVDSLSGDFLCMFPPFTENWDQILNSQFETFEQER